MRMNWGTGITVTIVVFMLVSFAFIYFAFNQDVNLVRDDYYEAEVEYSKTMDKVNRTEQLDEKLDIELVKNSIALHFPKNVSKNRISGNIFLYRPSENDKDLNVAIQLDTLNSQYISTENLLPGLWKIKVEWNSDSTTFVNNKILMVQ